MGSYMLNNLYKTIKNHKKNQTFRLIYNQHLGSRRNPLLIFTDFTTINHSLIVKENIYNLNDFFRTIEFNPLQMNTFVTFLK